MQNETQYGFRIQQVRKNVFNVYTTVNGQPHGVQSGDLETAKMMGETFKRAGVYFLLPYTVE